MVVVGAATRNSAKGGIVAGSRDHIAVGCKLGSIGGVLYEGDEPGIGCDAIVPLDEMVAVVGNGRNHDLSVVHIIAAAQNGAHAVAVAVYKQGIIIDGELGRIGDIARYNDGTGIIDITVVPLDKMIAEDWLGRDAGHVVVVVGPTAIGCTHIGVAYCNREGVDIGGEDGGENRVAVDQEGAWIDSAAIVPLHKMVAIIGRGGDCDGVVIFIQAAARNGAHSGIV